MELRPNDLPVMEKGEIRRVDVNISGAAGTNSISDTPTATCDNLTIGTVSYSGLTISFLVTATKTGNSNETVKGFVRAKVVDSTCGRNENGYG
jgi:hypothetical protein